MKTIDILLRLQGSDHGFRSNSARGRYGLREGQVPHIADAINLMDRSWNDVSVCDVINCWIKSTCLRDSLVEVAKTIAYEHGGTRHGCEETVNVEEANQLASGHALLQLSTLPQTPLIDLINGVSGYETAEDMYRLVHTPLPNEALLKQEICNPEIQQMYGNRMQASETETSDSGSSTGEVSVCANAINIVAKIRDLPGKQLHDTAFKSSSESALLRLREMENIE